MICCSRKLKNESYQKNGDQSITLVGSSKRRVHKDLITLHKMRKKLWVFKTEQIFLFSYYSCRI